MTTVVVVGGGLAGMGAARWIAGSVGVESVTVVEPKDYVEIPPGVMGALFARRDEDVGRRLSKAVVVGKRAWAGVRGLRHVQGRAVSVSREAAEDGAWVVDVQLTSASASAAAGSPNDTTEQVKADVLVIATGSETRVGMAAGWRPASSVTTLSQRLAEMHAFRAKLKAASRGILVVGGGVVGVESASWIASQFPDRPVHVLVAGKRLLEGFPPSLGWVSLRSLRRRSNVRVHLDQGMVSLPPDATSAVVKTPGGTEETIEFGAVVWAVGQAPATSFLPPSWLTDRKDVRVDKYLRVTLADGTVVRNAFALGDAGGVTRDKSAKSASRQAWIVAENVRYGALGARGDDKTPQHTYSRDSRGTTVSLGADGGAAFHFGPFPLRLYGLTYGGSAFGPLVRHVAFGVLLERTGAVWPYVRTRMAGDARRELRRSASDSEAQAAVVAAAAPSSS